MRLLRGEMDSATVYAEDPGAQASAFQSAGFAWLHVVDLNGAFAGRSVNGQAVEAILDAVDIPVQVGGGIRDMAGIETWLSRGIARVILGTAALRDPEFVKQACRAFPERIAVGIDARAGKVAVEGWAETSEMTALDLASAFEDSGVSAIIFTDIDRDGALQGLNVEGTAAFAAGLSTPVIASGGVTSHDDLKLLKTKENTGIVGVICGRALYDGRIEPKTALGILAG